MITTALLLGLLTVTTVTDWGWRKIYNWTTYPGILLALALNGAVSLAALGGYVSEDAPWHGAPGLQQSGLGLAACGGLMLVCYVFFPGGVGGGDIKLIAMIGAFLGVYDGLESLLWTLVIGGCAALVTLVWQVGVGRMLIAAARYVWLAVRSGGPPPLGPEERRPLKTQLFLSPSALAAVVLVRFDLIDWAFDRLGI